MWSECSGRKASEGTDCRVGKIMLVQDVARCGQSSLNWRAAGWGEVAERREPDPVTRLYAVVTSLDFVLAVMGSC